MSIVFAGKTRRHMFFFIGMCMFLIKSSFFNHSYFTYSVSFMFDCCQHTFSLSLFSDSLNLTTLLLDRWSDYSRSYILFDSFICLHSEEACKGEKGARKRHQTLSEKQWKSCTDQIQILQHQEKDKLVQ